ncbi:MAG: hypothetical protein MK081_15795 [Flavobacteriales bacterium]|uniref:hypothetical protein n=1 Tax=Sanyastnella coralliicola TaxID=3069118 RepID=UPI0027B8DEBE|nr:hypothetical protein [Longitalea sp. SCSIO 12813]MCH2200235.1 hypothetical protein [Flavobacteriales bacterium]
MSTNRTELKRAVHVIMNDVVEQCFHHMVHHPHLSDPLNHIIKDASEEINYQVIKIDAHSYNPDSPELQRYYHGISKDLQRKSLELLSRLQKIQQNV